MKRVLALDLGGTSLRAGRSRADDPAAIEMLGRWPAPRQPDALRAAILRLVEDLERDVPLAGIGITIPGLVEATTCRWVPNLPELEGVDLAALLGRPVSVGNDAHLALLAEAEGGAARGLRDVLLLAIGTGIGSAVLADGRILRGARGGACSFGWACADLNDPGAERAGWLERQASGSALDAAAAPGRDGPALIAAARQGNPDALAAVEHAGRAVGAVLAGAVGLLDPDAILLAGGVAEAFDLLAPAIQTMLRRHLPPHLQQVPIRIGAFGPQAGLVGAAFAAARGAQWWRLS